MLTDTRNNYQLLTEAHQLKHNLKLIFLNCSPKKNTKKRYRLYFCRKLIFVSKHFKKLYTKIKKIQLSWKVILNYKQN